MMAQRTDVFISSTSRDLPAHRQEAREACLRMGMFPIMMEALPALDTDAIQASLAMVDDAEIYVGIFAWRYGYVPAGHTISITEMEYNRAVERGIPRYIFIMHDEHEVKGSDLERGSGAAKLEQLKQRLMTEQVVSFFKSPADLRAHIIHALVPHRSPETGHLHSAYASDIPLPPAPYIAHPYTLLQTGNLIGRQQEMARLNQWATQATAPAFYFLIAIGGMGKSALTWHWFNTVAPQVMPDLAGRLWWSFYESDAHFENFITRTLAYVSRRPREVIEKLPFAEQEAQLLACLDQELFLLVLDGLERTMIAYARLEAARLTDDELDHQTANYPALPHDAITSYLTKHHLRKSADPRLGVFLRKLTTLKKSRLLVSSRLYPAELQTVTGEPVPGSHAHFLEGLADEDALALWQAYQVSGSPAALRELFHTFDNYPLLIRALAGEVASYRRAPGDFDRWRRDHPEFSPTRLGPVQVKSHVLAYAMQGLSHAASQVLRTVAAFRMPASYDTLAALLVGAGKLLPGEDQLDQHLSELEDRGLVGWDKRANRYDLHPIVRNVTWELLSETARTETLSELYTYFQSLPAASDPNPQHEDELTPLIETFYLLIALEKYDEANDFYTHRLYRPLTHTLSIHHKRIEILKALFNADTSLPRLHSVDKQSQVLHDLANAYVSGGQVRESVGLFELSIRLSRQINDHRITKSALNYFADALTLLGQLNRAEKIAQEALTMTRQDKDTFSEIISLFWLGTILQARGQTEAAQQAFLRSLSLSQGKTFQPAILAHSYYAKALLWQQDYAQALAMAARSWELCLQRPSQRNFIKAARLQGSAHLGLGDWEAAAERLTYALREARLIGYLEEELPAGFALGDLYRQQQKLGDALEIAQRSVTLAEQAGYQLLVADGYNLLAQLHREMGDPQAALTAAEQAYRVAWCDGPPFAYHWGLEAAKKHLDSLNVPYPTMPSFDGSQNDLIRLD